LRLSGLAEFITAEFKCVFKIKRTIAESRKNPDKVIIYMFQREKKNIGYAILVFFWSNEYGGNIVTIDELYVKEEYRTPSNQRAFNYYKKLGFVPSGNNHLIKQD